MNAKAACGQYKLLVGSTVFRAQALRTDDRYLVFNALSVIIRDTMLQLERLQGNGDFVPFRFDRFKLRLYAVGKFCHHFHVVRTC